MQIVYRHQKQPKNIISKTDLYKKSTIQQSAENQFVTDVHKLNARKESTDGDNEQHIICLIMFNIRYGI